MTVEIGLRSDLTPLEGGHFFHYTTGEAAFEHILPKHQLRLSPYAWMRDPLEAQPPGLGANMRIDADRTDLDDVHYTLLEATELVRRKRNEAKLLSLTVDATGYEQPDEVFGRGFARARMWEQYAEQHQGVCLVFERSRLTSLVEEQIEARGGRAYAGPVVYSRTGLSGTDAKTIRATRQDITSQQLAAEHLSEHVDSFFLLKLVDWESEHEFRFVELASGMKYTEVDFDDTLIAVVLGKNFPAHQIYGAIEKCQLCDAEIHQMAWQVNRPTLLRPKLPDGRIVYADGTISLRAAPAPFTHEDLEDVLGAEDE